jgi:hypothetical protein
MDGDVIKSKEEEEEKKRWGGGWMDMMEGIDVFR